MMDKEHGPERADTGDGLGDADPTLDIVRQLIEEAEAIPAPAQKPAAPTTPRPEAAPRVPDPAPLPIPDADPDIWDDDDDAETWDDLYAGEAGPGYKIVDIDGDQGDDPIESAESFDPAPAPESAVRRVLRRWRQALGAWTRAQLAALAERIAAFLRRPDAPRRLSVALLVIFVIAWPREVLWLTLLVPLAALITWASVGSDGCVELVEKWYDRMKARDPDKAERIRKRAAAVTRALNHGIERLPETWTRGLYLPDFETDGYVPEKLKVDPFEELAAKVHSAKRTGEGA